MPKSVCALCNVELHPETNGVIVAEMFQENKEIYKLWKADLWKCPQCGYEVVLGFAENPFAEHYRDDCKLQLENEIAAGKRIIYDNELFDKERRL